MTKQELRNHIKAQIKCMTMEERQAASLRVCRQIIGTPEWQEAGTVWLYAALPDEVDLMLLIREAEQSGKQILLPVVDGDELLIRCYDPQHIAQQGQYHISEPTAQCPTISSLDMIDLAIIPGRAFTHDGLRMGRGKGYYDRTLSALSCPKWGVAFACQVVDTLPTDPWDIPLDRIFVG